RPAGIVVTAVVDVVDLKTQVVRHLLLDLDNRFVRIRIAVAVIDGQVRIAAHDAEVGPPAGRGDVEDVLRRDRRYRGREVVEEDPAVQQPVVALDDGPARLVHLPRGTHAG